MLPPAPPLIEPRVPSATTKPSSRNIPAAMWTHPPPLASTPPLPQSFGLA